MPGPRCNGSLIMGLIAGALAGAAGGLLLALKLDRGNPEITRDSRGRYRDRSGRYVANPYSRSQGRDSPGAPDAKSLC